MTVSTQLDSNTVAWLASLDPALAFLAVAPPATDPAFGSPHDVCWTPGEGCRLAYRRSAPRTAAEFVAVAVTADGWRSHDFRDDPALPGLRPATDPSVVAELLATVLEGPAVEPRIEAVRYRPGSRCVLRYDVKTPTGDRVFYAKVLEGRAFDALVPVLAALQDQEGWGQLGPPVRAVWPQLRTILTAGAPGVSGGAVLGDLTWPLEARALLARRFGDLLGRLHALEGVTVPPWTAAAQIASLRSSLVAAARVDAELGSQAGDLLDRLEARLPPSVAGVLSHGGFRAGQVVVGDGAQLSLLDMDGCRLSDRCLDLGTALAQLYWRSAQQPSLQAAYQPVEDALLAGYRSRAQEVSLESLDWWRAAALLQVAARRYRRLETWDWPSVPMLVAAATRLIAAWESRPAPVTGTDLLDVHQMSTVLGPLLAGRSRVLAPTTIDSACQLAVAEGRRVVVRYSLCSADGEPARPVVAKVFSDLAKAQLLAQHLRLLSGPFQEAGLRVPNPLGVVEAQRLVLLELVDGTPLTDITDPPSVEQGVRRAGQWLARLHASGVILPRVLSLTQEAVTAQQWAAAVGRAFPDLAHRAERLAHRWEAAARSAGVGRIVPLHKDFHAGHVLVGDEVSVVDLDEARLGDAAVDVAHFCTYLDAAHDGLRSAALRRAFLETYADGSGWVDQGSFGPWCAYTWLKIAKQQAGGRGPLRAPAEERRSNVKAALDKGDRWLSG